MPSLRLFRYDAIRDKKEDSNAAPQMMMVESLSAVYSFLKSFAAKMFLSKAISERIVRPDTCTNSGGKKKKKKKRAQLQ